MKKTEFTKFELARMKRTAQNVDGYLKQKTKLQAQLDKIQAGLNSINQLIDLNDAATVAMTGYHSEDIIKKVVTPTDQVDKNGNVIKKVTYEFKYPDTIIPPSDSELPEPPEEVYVNIPNEVGEVDIIEEDYTKEIDF